MAKTPSQNVSRRELGLVSVNCEKERVSEKWFAQYSTHPGRPRGANRRPGGDAAKKGAVRRRFDEGFRPQTASTVSSIQTMSGSSKRAIHLPTSSLGSECGDELVH